MTLVEFRYLVALAATGSFSKAAERCNVSQPSLSVAIAKIEDELGIALFERSKSQVRVTCVGRKVVAQAELVLREVDKVRDIARYGRDQLAGPLRLGVIHTIAPYLLPVLVRELRRLAPQMPLLIEENMTATLAQMLQQSEIDAAILALPFEMAALNIEPLYDERFVVAVPRGHAWESRAALSPEDIVGDEVLLLKAGNCFRDQVLGACPQVSNAETDIRLGHSIGTLRSMVASGLGVSVLPASAMQPPYGSDLISIIPFTDPQPHRRVVLVWRKSFVRPKAIAALAAAVRAIPLPAFQPVCEDT